MPCFFPAVPCAGRSGRAYCIHGSSQHNAQRKTWPPGRLSMSIFRHVGHLMSSVTRVYHVYHLLLDQSVVHHGCPTAMHITVLQGFWGRKGLCARGFQDGSSWSFSLHGTMINSYLRSLVAAVQKSFCLSNELQISHIYMLKLINNSVSVQIYRI